MPLHRAKPWGVAWGEVAYAPVTAGQGSITSLVDLTGLTSGSITPPAGRKLKVTLSVMMQSNAAGDRLDLAIADGSGTILQLRSASASTASINEELSAILRTTSTGAAMTFKGQAQRGGGTGTLTTSASALSPAFILVEDVGPA